ncbi:MAG: S-layer homology domain-containing protein [Thermoleophilia bacterium]
MYPSGMSPAAVKNPSARNAVVRMPSSAPCAGRTPVLLVILSLYLLLGVAFVPAGVLTSAVPTPVGSPWTAAFGPAPARAATAAEILGQQMLAEINAVRAEVGEPPVASHAALETSAQNHADYLLANTDLWGIDSAHKERPDRPGFTATDSYLRAQLAGFSHWKVAEVVVSSFGGSAFEAEEVVRMWLDAPLHRRALLERSVASAGFAYGSDGYHRAYVLDVGHVDPYVYHPVYVQPYPADGQTDVPTSWNGNENPQPFPELEGSYPSGYPITVFPVWGGREYVSSSLSVRRASDGAAVPVVRSTVPGFNYAFAPRSPLEAGTEYTATFTYTAANEYGGIQTSGVLTWSFTTAGGSTTTSTTSSTTTTMTTTTTTVPTTTTTTTAPTTTTAAPTTTTTALPLPSFSDVATTHPYRDAILALAAAGVVNGYVEQGGGPTFRPDASITRQHFAKMIALSLGIPVSEDDICGFPDVDVSGAGSLYPDNYVAAAAARGITRGTSASPPRFSPWRPISRAQVLTMVVRAARSELPDRLVQPPASFPGILPVGDPAHGDNVRWAEGNGLLDGIALAGWDVWASASRGEVAQILWNLTR